MTGRKTLLMKDNLQANEVITGAKLYGAYISCVRRKVNKLSHATYFSYLEKNLLCLLERLQNRSYSPESYRCFVVKKPVIREVFAPAFQDRIVHHLLVRELEPFFEKLFIYDSFACRAGKGTHLAMRRLKSGLQSLEDSHGNGYFLKLDVSAFFMSIDKNILLKLLHKHIYKIAYKKNKSTLWVSEILWLCEVIIKSDPVKSYHKCGQLDLFEQVPRHKSLFHTAAGKGLPIGSLTSQFFANIYLNELDQFCKRALKCYYYYRYVDDFVILNQSRKTLEELHAKIERFLDDRLALSLNMNKTVIGPTQKGIDFVGYIVRNKYVLVRHSTVKRMEKRVSILREQSVHIGYELHQLESFNASISSYRSVLCHANGWKLYSKFIGLPPHRLTANI